MRKLPRRISIAASARDDKTTVPPLCLIAMFKRRGKSSARKLFLCDLLHSHAWNPCAVSARHRTTIASLSSSTATSTAILERRNDIEAPQIRQREDVSIDSLNSHVTEIKSGAESGKGAEYNFDGVDPGFSTNSMFDFGSIAKSSSFRTVVSNIVKDKTSFYRHRLKQHYPEGHVERHLQRTANIKQCEQECAFDNTSCTCEELKQCALEMSSYDLSLLVLGDYVNTQKESPEYGNFIAENLNLFGIATTTLPTKFARIRRLAKTRSDCTELLTEFTTMCDPEASSCSSKNEYAHQLTTEQVCVSVGSAKKLRISAM